MLRKLGIGVGVLVLGLVVLVATRPARLHVERSTVVAAGPQVVYDLVEDLRRWREWSPWDERDPSVRRSYSGPERGLGAGYAWTGNDEVGEGRMTITAVAPARSVELRLEFLKPFASTSTVSFTFVPEDAGSKVTWATDGSKGFAAKAYGMFVDMDRMLGGDFEQGLSKLKARAEAESARRAEREERAIDAEQRALQAELAEDPAEVRPSIAPSDAAVDAGDAPAP